MLSESARMASAQEARFRVNYPNSEPRTIKVVALDEASRDLEERAATSSTCSPDEWVAPKACTASASAVFTGALSGCEIPPISM